MICFAGWKSTTHHTLRLRLLLQLPKPYFLLHRYPNNWSMCRGRYRIRRNFHYLSALQIFFSGFCWVSCKKNEALEDVDNLHFSRASRSEEHTSELQSRQYLVCRLLLEKTKESRLCS